jgi:hypothetical protein
VDASLDGWKHLRPKALQIGDDSRPVRKATVVHSGQRHHFWCDMSAGAFVCTLSPTSKAEAELVCHHTGHR